MTFDTKAELRNMQGTIARLQAEDSTLIPEEVDALEEVYKALDRATEHAV